MSALFRQEVIEREETSQLLILETITATRMPDYPTDLNGDEEDSVLGSYHTSDEDSKSNDGTDIDEYASFNTDIGKYQYDQRRWNGTEHGRKYTRDPRHKEERRQKAKARKEEKAKTIIKPEEQDKSEASPKAKRKGKKKVAAPLATVAEVPAEGDIHFDTLENLWYTHHKGGIPVYKRAPKHKEECHKKANSLKNERENSQSTVSASTRFNLSLQALKATLSTQSPVWNVFTAAGLELMNCWGTL